MILQQFISYNTNYIIIDLILNILIIRSNLQYLINKKTTIWEIYASNGWKWKLIVIMIEIATYTTFNSVKIVLYSFKLHIQIK